jgi:hypothetical protein
MGQLDVSEGIEDMNQLRLTIATKKLGAIAVMLLTSACTPHFNRDGQTAAQTPAGMGLPVQDLTAQGGASTPGVTSHYKITRVVIGGNIQRNKAQTSSGKTVQGGPSASQ